jgi:KDO2-lipid IV(A) lauroyltransferase
MTALLLALMRFVHPLPLPVLRAAGAMLGAILHRLARERRRIAAINLANCQPQLDVRGRERLLKETFRLFGQGFVDRAILWHAPAERLRRMIELRGAEHLIAAIGRPVILLAPHFVGLDAAWLRLTLERRMATMYANQKNPAFNRALIAGRGRFNQPVLLSRQDGVREAFRAMRSGLPLYYLPDMDFGPRDAIFVPFFGVPAATVTAVSRIARLADAVVLPCIATLTPKGYEVVIHPPWQGYPGADIAADTRRMNAFIEQQVLLAPAQYHWLHKRFKTRPPGAAPLY